MKFILVIVFLFLSNMSADQKSTMQALIINAGYACDSVTSVSQTFSGFAVACRKGQYAYFYLYRIKDVGGKWEVSPN